jgi:hypothetical protein
MMLEGGVHSDFQSVHIELDALGEWDADQVDCFWTDWNGQVSADSFPIDVLQME